MRGLCTRGTPRAVGGRCERSLPTLTGGEGPWSMGEHAMRNPAHRWPRDPAHFAWAGRQVLRKNLVRSMRKRRGSPF